MGTPMTTTHAGFLGAALGCLVATSAAASPVQPHAPTMLTEDDYARAEAFLGHNTTPLLDHAVTRVEWLDGERFWYRDQDADGVRYRIFDVSAGKARDAFDHDAIAAALPAPGEGIRKAGDLEIRSIEPAGDDRLRLLVDGTYYLCGIDAGATCEAVDLPGGDEPVTGSPDGRLGAFIRGWNLWVRALRTGEETQLTTDGAEHHGYATDNAGWTHSDRASLARAPHPTRTSPFRLHH